MTLKELQNKWYNSLGQFYSRRLRLMIARHTWGKSLNTPMHPITPPLGDKMWMLMNDLLTEPEVHRLLMAESAFHRSEYLRLIKDERFNKIVPMSTDIELIKAQEVLLHLLEQGSHSLEPASQYEVRELRLSEPRPES